MKPRYPKTLLRGRTPEQLEFDMGVKGWAFQDGPSLGRTLERAKSLYGAIGFKDPDRLSTLMAIDEAVDRASES